jgi:competence protein ComEC
MACSVDACVGTVRGRRLFATRSRDWLERGEMEAACAGADIVVSDRRLPGWCRPRWLRLGRDELAVRGAVAVWLERGRVVGARDGVGDHPWREQSGWR